MTSMMTPLKVTAAAILLVGIAACSAFSPPPEFRGAEYQSPAPPPDFSLISAEGGDYRLHEHTSDRVTLIFFGYTFCPDVCPGTLGTVKTAINRLPEQDRLAIQLLFITTDPARDSADRLAGYLARYDSMYIGLMPTESQLPQLKSDYGVFSQIEGEAGEEDYLIAHTSLIYVLDRQGNLRAGFLDGMSAIDMAYDLQILIAE
jgi:protein SCO1/2